MKDEELRAWAYLSAVAEPPCAPLIALVDDVGAVAAAAAIKQRAVPSAHRRVLVPTEARAAVDRSAQDLETCERIGARLVTRDDADWPAWQLLALDRADTAARGGAPLALWVRGPRTCAEIADSSLALIGSRAASSYGDYVAGQMAGQLADDELHGLGHVRNVVCCERAQAVEVGVGPQGVLDHRPGAGAHVDPEPDGVGGHDDLAVEDGGIHVVAPDGLERDLGRQLGLLDRLEDRALAADRPVLGQAAARLTHEPHRPPTGGPARRGVQERNAQGGRIDGHAGRGRYRLPVAGRPSCDRDRRPIE